MRERRSAWHTNARRLVAGVVSMCISLLALHAAAPVFWRVSTQAEFLRGDVDNLSIDADGQLTLGPDTAPLFDPNAPFLWDVARGPDALWIGSGNAGKVFRVQGDNTATTVFEAREQNVHAIAPTADGAALVGTSPDGSVFRVGRSDPEMIFDPDDKYIWAIALDANGGVFVATGPDGKIYRVSPDGESTLFYDADATHVLTLAFDTEGNLLAGTGSPGQVIRIDGTGRAFVLLDSPFTEIRALHLTPEGALYAAAVGQSPARAQPAPPPARSPGVPTVTTSATVTSVVVADAVSVPTTSEQPTETQSTESRGAVYLIHPDGVWDSVWDSSEDAPYDITLSADGHLIIGTGGHGKIFQVMDDPPRVVLLARAPAQQVTGFASGPDRSRYYVTSNPGRVYRLGGDRAASGTYVSEVRDAETVATWGTLRWRAATPDQTSVRLFTRSGNTAAPNDTWSPWSEAYTDPVGSQITSPKARYLQWKTELGGNGDTPTLLSVTTAYLPQNLRPEISSLTVHDPGVAFQKPFSSGDPPIAGLDDLGTARTGGDASATTGDAQPTTLGRRVYRKGLQTFVWTARDPNKDALSFDVLYRSETDLSWNPLRTGIADSIFTWDTTSVPDGTYIVRIVASDAQSNTPGAALTGLAEGTPFDIDNSPPRITIDPPRSEDTQVVVMFVVRDTRSAVNNVEYSFDAEHWHVLHPLDGIADSRVEHFQLAVDRDQAGRLVIRATDAMNNVVTAAAR